MKTISDKTVDGKRVISVVYTEEELAEIKKKAEEHKAEERRKQQEEAEKLSAEEIVEEQ